MQEVNAERVLTGLLRFLAALTLLALVPMVMPTDWMAAMNDRLGLEPLARTPLTEYLTRSLSAVYALFGALTLYASRDVRRYAPFIGFAGKLTVVLGVFFFVLDSWAGLPATWIWFEGPPTVVLGFVMVYLARQVTPLATFGGGS